MDTILSGKQRHFAWMVGQLITWAYAHGYELVLGECKRDPRVAQLDAESGAGISNSLHLLSLAIDVALFIGGSYQTDSAAYTPLGEYWESLGGTWGGRFTRPDGNHFSLEHNGVR